MAGSPEFKLYNSSGEYVGCMKHPEDAAAMVAILGSGATIRQGHSTKAIVWREGSEAIPAGESYDIVAKTIHERINARRAAFETERASAPMPKTLGEAANWPTHPDGRPMKIFEMTGEQARTVTADAIERLKPDFASIGIDTQFRG